MSHALVREGTRKHTDLVTLLKASILLADEAKEALIVEPTDRTQFERIANPVVLSIGKVCSVVPALVNDRVIGEIDDSR